MLSETRAEGKYVCLQSVFIGEIMAHLERVFNGQSNRQRGKTSAVESHFLDFSKVVGIFLPPPFILTQNNSITATHAHRLNETLLALVSS